MFEREGYSRGVALNGACVAFCAVLVRAVCSPLTRRGISARPYPQVPLFSVLKKFDGETEYEVLRPAGRKKFKISRLPRWGAAS